MVDGRALQKYSLTVGRQASHPVLGYDLYDVVDAEVVGTGFQSLIL
jgi:hypothetical protein